MWPSLEYEQKQFYFQTQRRWILKMHPVPTWPLTNISEFQEQGA
jgi:hypothetical protein